MEEVNKALMALKENASKSLTEAEAKLEAARADLNFIKGYIYALEQINPAITEIKKKTKVEEG